jgi:hypothetical protein
MFMMRKYDLPLWSTKSAVQEYVDNYSYIDSHGYLQLSIRSYSAIVYEISRLWMEGLVHLVTWVQLTARCGFAEKYVTPFYSNVHLENQASQDTSMDLFSKRGITPGSLRTKIYAHRNLTFVILWCFSFALKYFLLYRVQFQRSRLLNLNRRDCSSTSNV